jgi:hypothetical protein
LELDAYTRVWQSHGSAQRRAVLYGLTGLAVGLLVTLGYRTSCGEAPNALLPVVAGLAVIALGLLMDRLLSGRLSGRFVAVTGRGIVVGVRRQRRLISWEEAGQVKLRGRVPKIEQLGTATLLALEDVFEDATEIAAFRQAVETGRRRYRDTAHPPAADGATDAASRDFRDTFPDSRGE